MSQTLQFVRHNAFLSPDSASAKLYEEASRFIPGGSSRVHYHFQPNPLYAKSASGCYLTDAEGVERLDFLNNMTALIHGHGNPAVKQALIDQIERGTAFSEPAEEEISLARLMSERVSTVEQIRFGNSGTESVMLAIKLARAHTGRSMIAKFEGFYHGYYDYAQISNGLPGLDLGDEHAPTSVAGSGGLSDSVSGDVLVLPFNNRPVVERLLEENHQSISALILDPLSNKAGFVRPVEGFLQFLREITSEYGIVLIFDEVISFRISHGGGQGAYGGEPDLTVFGKIIGGGLPVGAVGGRRDIMALLDPSLGNPVVASGGTFSANPLTMVAGYAALEQMTPAEYDRIGRLGRKLRDEGNSIIAAAGAKGQITGDGSLFRILFTDEPIANYRSSMQQSAVSDLIAKLHINLLDEGVIISKTLLGCLSTPMGEQEVGFFLSALERSLHRALGS